MWPSSRKHVPRLGANSTPSSAVGPARASPDCGRLTSSNQRQGWSERTDGARDSSDDHSDRRHGFATAAAGQIDRALFTANANFYFGQQALDDFRTSLSPLGAIRSLRQASASLRGGFRYRRFAVEFANGTRANLSTYWTMDGTIEQFLLEPAD